MYVCVCSGPLGWDHETRTADAQFDLTVVGGDYIPADCSAMFVFLASNVMLMMQC